MITKIVDVEQSLQKLRYQYHFELKLKKGDITIVPTTKFTEQELNEINKLKQTVRDKKAEAVAVLLTMRERLINSLRQQQKYCKEHYDDYFTNPEVYLRYMSSYEDFQHTEKMLLADFDYGLECIWSGICPEAPMCCEYCSRTGNWRTKNV